MRPTKKATYRTGEFARLAGVTVRTLHYYDRIGLLQPRRTSAGYRIYAASDLRVVEQIVALKFIGVPLREISRLLQSSDVGFGRAVRAQRRMLERRRELLERAIEAIWRLESSLSDGQRRATPEMLRQVIEVMEMKKAIDAKQQYDDLVRQKIERLRSLSPESVKELRAQWNTLVGEIRGALTEDPAGPKAQEFAARWVALLSQLMGRAVNADDFRTTQEWNPQMASFVDKAVGEFMVRVLAARG